MFDQVVSTFPEEEVLEEEKKRNLCNPIVKYGVESLEKNSDAGTAGYLFTKELLLQYMEGNNGRRWRVKRRAQLDVWIEGICDLLKLFIGKKDDACIPKSKGWYLIARMDSLRQCRDSDFEVMVPGRIPGFLVTVTNRECSSL